MALPFAVPPTTRTLCRQGRVVGRVWETPEAQFCLLAGVQPPDLAAAGFYIAFTPTAAAAPVIMGMLDGDVQFTAAATISSDFEPAVFS